MDPVSHQDITGQGTFRLVIDGGTPCFCEFDYRVRALPHSSGCKIELAENLDSVSERLFPDLRRGMLNAIRELHESGELVPAHVEILSIRGHPTDSSPRCFELYGRKFVYTVLCAREEPLGWPDPARAARCISAAVRHLPSRALLRVETRQLLARMDGSGTTFTAEGLSELLSELSAAGDAQSCRGAYWRRLSEAAAALRWEELQRRLLSKYRAALQGIGS